MFFAELRQKEYEMKQLYKRLFTLLLASMMLFGAVACGNTATPDNTGDETVDGGAAEVTTAPVTEAPPEYVFGGTTYDGADFVVLVGGTGTNTFNDFEYNAENATVLDEAVYTKNTAVEEEYKIVISYVEAMGTETSASAKLTTQHRSGDESYHLATVSCYATVPLATNAVLYDLTSIENLDMTHSWWDQNINEECSVKDVLFFTTGDISVWDDMQQLIVMFNKDLYKTEGFTDNLYTVVDEGKWTYDKLAELAKEVTEDVEGNDKMDMADKYGVLLWDDTIYGVFGSAGAKIVSKNEQGDLTLTINDEKGIDALLKYTEIAASGNAINYQRFGSSGTPAINMFSESRALFFFGRLQSFDNFRDMETAYGVLPYPKLTEMQEEYHTTLSYYHATFYCTVNLDFDIEMRGTVMDALGYYSQKHLTSAYETKMLEGTYVRDEESVKTLRLCADSRAYDFGFFGQPANINKELIYLFRALSTGFASKFEEKRDAAESKLAEYNEGFAAAAQEWGK